MAKGVIMPDRIYRDPVLGSIAFDREKENYVVELIDTPEFQRLRRVRQLGAAFLAFHGAEHSRFSHSVGVASLAKRMFDRLTLDPLFPANSVQDKDEMRKAVIAGALLHDIGHGPFSHLFERVFSSKAHEQWGLDIIQNSGPINGILQKFDLVEPVKKIFTKTFKPRFARDIISSQLDADRLDYLLRDSYMTGVAYGQYDLDWLLEVIELANIPTDGKDLGLAINSKKGWHAAEQFVIGRYLMYQQVYFHKTIRAAERMIKLIFERLTEMAREEKFPRFCPVPLRSLLDPDPRTMNVDAYLRLDDQFMLTCFGVWSHDEEDDTLRDLCGRVVTRDLFKTAVVDTSKIRDHLKFTAAIDNLKEKITQQGFKPQYYLASDSAEDFPYKDIVWFITKDKSPEDIWLAEKGVAKQSLSNQTASPLINSIRNTPVTTQRFCFPKELKLLVYQYLAPYLLDGGENASALNEIPAGAPEIPTKITQR
jgi:HD superfamily phosphohydrolase